MPRTPPPAPASPANFDCKDQTDRKTILKAMKTPPPGGYYVWDGVDEDNRPATDEEFEAGMAAARTRRKQQATERHTLEPRLAAFDPQIHGGEIGPQELVGAEIFWPDSSTETPDRNLDKKPDLSQP